MGKKEQRRQAISDRLTSLKPEGEATKRAGAEVRPASDPAGKPVWIWRLDPACVTNSRARRGFKALLEQMRALPPHPALLAVQDGGTDDGEGQPYLITARVEGESLAKALERGPLGGNDALDVARDLLEGLSHLHARGVYHLALSPEQLLLVRESGRLRGKLLPAGFTRLAGPETDTPWGRVRVDPEWAALEVVKGEPADATSDVYSAALLIHAMLAGQHPVPASGRDRLAARVLGEPGELPKHAVSDPAREAALREALRRALKKDPARRCAGALELLRAMEPGAAPPPESVPVLPDGGACAVCAAPIPPVATRTWDRHASDRPFRCPSCADALCGKLHWDAKAATCKRCGEKAVQKTSHSDLQVISDTGEVAAVAPEPPSPAEERSRALKALAEVARPDPRPSKPAPAPKEPAQPVDPAAKPVEPAPKSIEPAPKPIEPAPKPVEPAPKPVEPAQKPIEPAPVVARGSKTPPPRPAEPAALSTADAVLDAWQSEKQKRNTARARAEAARSGTLEPLPAAPPAPAARSTAAPVNWLTTDRLLLVAVGFALLVVCVTWAGDHSSTMQRLATEVDLRRASRGEAEAAALANARAVEDLYQQLSVARGAQDEERTRAADATRALAAAQADLTSEQGRSRQAAAAAQAGQRRLSELEGQLRRAEGEVAAIRSELLQTRSQQEGTASRLRAAEESATKRLGALDAQVREARLANDQSQRERDAARRDLEAAAGRVAELERQVAALQERPPAPAALTGAAEEVRSALTLTPLSGEAPPEGGSPLGGPGPWPARAVLRAPLTAVRAQLEQARAGEAVVSVQVRLTGEGAPALRLSGQAAPAATRPDPRRPGRHAAPAPQEAGLARFWVSPALAEAWLAGAPAGEERELVLLLEPAPGEVGQARASAAELVASPVAGDVALRLRELEARAR